MGVTDKQNAVDRLKGMSVFALCTESPSLNESEALHARMTSFINIMHCCVHQCVNDTSYSDELSIRTFPKDKPLRKIWIRKPIIIKYLFSENTYTRGSIFAI